MEQARARTDTNPPLWTVPPDSPLGRVSAVEIYPQGGPWVPLVDPAARLARPVEVGDGDPLRVALATLARLGLVSRRVQLIVTPERHTTAGPGRSPWWARGLLAVALSAGAVDLAAPLAGLRTHTTRYAGAVGRATPRPCPVHLRRHGGREGRAAAPTGRTHAVRHG